MTVAVKDCRFQVDVILTGTCCSCQHANMLTCQPLPADISLCYLQVHTACKSQLPRKCSMSIAKYSVLSPLCIQSLDSSGLCAANNCHGGTASPLLVFVNSKSGDNHGVKFLRRFKQLLNPAQVFDLMNGGPVPGYVCALGTWFQVTQTYSHICSV